MRPDPLNYTDESEYWNDVFETDYGSSSLSELDRKDARERGFHNKDSQWVLSDRDVWHHNPYYRGPDQPHPEDDPSQYEDE